MAPSNSNHWTTDPEYIELLNYIIEKAENVESPMPIKLLAKEFKEKSGAVQTLNCLNHRIRLVRTMIQSFEHMGTNTKVRMMFVLSASVDADFLKELKKNALVVVDKKKRITYYKANEGSLELRGDHSRSAKNKAAQLESNWIHQKLIRAYFENKNNADAVPRDEKTSELWELLKWITEKCENRNSPLSINLLAKDFINHFGIPVHTEAIRRRIKKYCREIQKAELLDTQTSVKQLFCLSAAINSNYLEKLRKDAHVEVDKENRISYYKAKNGDLELTGDHSRSAKITTGKLESKGSLRSLINSYFENMNDSDAVPKNEEEEEVWNLIGFITEKCENINSPLNITQFSKDFNKRFGSSRSFDCIYDRTRKYCHEIQKADFLDTPSKVKQLFGLGARLDLDCLEKLRKDAVVEVDNLNRITTYTSNDGCLTLHGEHRRSAKRKLSWIVRRKSKKIVKTQCISDGDEDEDSEIENGCSEDDSDEYSSEEFDSEFDSEDENEHLDETEKLTEPSNKVDDFDNETPVRNCSQTEISIADNFEFDPPTERSHRSEETGIGEDQRNDPEIIGNTSVRTRYGRLSKRRHLDAASSNNQVVDSSSLGTSMNTDPASSKTAKQKKIAIEKEKLSHSSRQSRCISRSIKRSSRNSSFSTFSTELEENMENHDAPEAEGNPSDYHGPRIQEIEDYDYNPREDNIPGSSPIDNRLAEPELPSVDKQNTNIEAQNTDIRADAVASEPEPVEETITPQNNKNSTQPTNAKEVISQETPIKVEQEEPVENPTEDVKPETTHNFKIKFFNAMRSLILSLDTPSLFGIQSKIQQKIRTIGTSGKMFSNDEMIPALELLAARMANHSVIDISEVVKSVSLIQFFCYLKASILNSEMSGMEGLLKNISKRIEESQNKKIPMEKVENALRATLDIDGF